jgi:putative MATE family efflux protein
MNQENKINDRENITMKSMTEGNEAKAIIRFSVPLLLGNVFQQLYSTVDGIVVGRAIGPEALAGVGASFPILFLIIALLMGLGMGATVLISQFYGAKDYESVIKIADSVLISNIGISIVLSIIGFVLTDPFLRLLHTPIDVMPYASVYLKITFAGMIGMVGYNLTSAILRGLGDSKTPLYFLIIASLINLILLLLFVLVFKTGIAGAALATVIAQLCSFIFAIIYLNKTHPIIRIDIRHMKFDKRLFVETIKIGLPSGLQQMLVSVSMIIIQAIINPFGTAVIAGVTAAGRIQQFAFMPIMNINMAMSAFAGQNIGAGKMERLDEGFKAAIKISTFIAIFFTVICALWGSNLMSLFSTDARVITIGSEFLFIVMPFTIPACVMFISMATVRGAGDAVATLIISMIALWCIRIPAALILPNFLGYQGVFLAGGLDWAVGAVIAYAYYRSGHWKKKISIDRIRNMEENEVNGISNHLGINRLGE